MDQRGGLLVNETLSVPTYLRRNQSRGHSRGLKALMQSQQVPKAPLMLPPAPQPLSNAQKAEQELFKGMNIG